MSDQDKELRSGPSSGSAQTRKRSTHQRIAEAREKRKSLLKPNEDSAPKKTKKVKRPLAHPSGRATEMKADQPKESTPSKANSPQPAASDPSANHKPAPVYHSDNDEDWDIEHKGSASLWFACLAVLALAIVGFNWLVQPAGTELKLAPMEDDGASISEPNAVNSTGDQ